VARIAVVLFNLGGPDQPDAVQPFLFNLFSDPAIIRLPQPFRWMVAKLISSRRAPVAREIYANLGGGSPLLPNTKAQAAALEAALGPEHKCFIAMRYWHPRGRQTAQEVAAWAPDRIILLPLYPQFSSTTTASSMIEWRAEARRAGLRAPETLVCCYPEDPGFIAALASRVREGLAQAGDRPGGCRILFSAHGLPARVIAAGDPYRWQVEASVAAAMRAVGPGIDHVMCFQSRVGPLEWIGPSTEDEIKRAAADGVAVVVVPVAFVSEHSETLVELDIEYRHLAEQSGIECYVRVPTVDTAPDFIEGLAQLVRNAAGEARPLCGPDARCPADRLDCPWQRRAPF
jgi:ferrochelatase